MAVALRLKQLGTKNRPLFRVIAVDSRKTRDGKSLANLGHYNPLTDPATLTLDSERVMNFLQTGAQPTDAVRNLLRQQGIIKSERGEWVKSPAEGK